MICLCSYNGLLLFATYYECDPLATRLAKAPDQLLPLLVMEILKDLPGLPGLFVAGIFSAALSSLSTMLNSLSAVFLEDFFKPFMKDGLSERASKYIMRGTVLILGLVSLSLVYVVQHLGAVLQLSMTLPTACFGPMLGVFVVGFTLPWIGKRSVFYATIIGCIAMMIIVLKAQTEMATGHMNMPETKSLSVEGCLYNFTSQHDKVNSFIQSDSSIPHKSKIYEISYLYYTLVGSMVVVIASFALSFIFGFQDPNKVDAKLLAPLLRKYFDSYPTEEKIVNEEGKEFIVHNFELKENLSQ
jgi:solute carrier family 5 (sodium-coupled monocarboxylate transporter), member 8/12